VSDPGTDDLLVEVPVHAAILRATANLLELLNDFFTGTDPATRTRLGSYLVNRRNEENAADAATQTTILLQELDEAAQLLHTLAGDDNARPCSEPTSH
jgi:hypothetical protein